MAVKANNRIWIHLAHPSGLNGHFKTWLNEATGAGLKRIQAVDAMPINNMLFLPDYRIKEKSLDFSLYSRDFNPS